MALFGGAERRRRSLRGLGGWTVGSAPTTRRPHCSTPRRLYARVRTRSGHESAEIGDDPARRGRPPGGQVIFGRANQRATCPRANGTRSGGSASTAVGASSRPGCVRAKAVRGSHWPAGGGGDRDWDRHPEDEERCRKGRDIRCDSSSPSPWIGLDRIGMQSRNRQEGFISKNLI